MRWLLLILLLILLIVVSSVYYYEINKDQIKANIGRTITGALEILPKTRVFQDAVFHTEERFNTKADLYQPITSDRQIKTIAKFGNAQEYGRLITLLGKHLGYGPQKTNTLNQLDRYSDAQIYEMICRAMQRDEGERGTHQAKSLYRPLYYLNKTDSKKYLKYLDMGCGNGLITAEFAKLIGAEETHCVEVGNYTHPDIKYHKITPASDKLSYADDYFDLITCVMSLHHMEKLPEMLAEINRVLAPGGTLLIKEHDCWNSIDAMLIDIEHAIFMYCLDKNKSFNGYILHYKNRDDWRDMLNSLDYQCGDYFYTSPRQEISATRAFWQIYQKAGSKTKAKK